MKIKDMPREICRMLLENGFGVLATYGGEHPYTSLVSLAFAEDFGCLVFPTLRETRKYANVRHETRVSVLLDNRAFEKAAEKLYALTILGAASETDKSIRPACEEILLLRHPHLAGFLALPQTALVQVIPEKIVLVEEFQKIREYDFA